MPHSSHSSPIPDPRAEIASQRSKIRDLRFIYADAHRRKLWIKTTALAFQIDHAEHKLASMVKSCGYRHGYVVQTPYTRRTA